MRAVLWDALAVFVLVFAVVGVPMLVSHWMVP
jgi:hypothetical protein